MGAFLKTVCKSLCLPVSFALLLAACDRERIYETNIEFRDRTWKVQDTVVFDFRIQDLSPLYKLSCDLRNTIDYPYSRIFVTYHLLDSTGRELETKMVSQFLFDQKTGAPFGSSGIGDVYDHRFPLLSDYEFKNVGRYRVRLEQFMRQDTLPGIVAAGLRVERQTK